MSRMKILLSVLFLFLSVSLYTQPLSLTELIDMGLQNNPATEKAWANTKRAQAALGIARSGDYPSLNATGTGMHGREVKYPNASSTTFTDYGAELSLNYLLFDFGERRAGVNATKEALKAARWSTDFTMQRVIYRVCAHYYEYLDAEEILKISERTLKDSQLICEAAEDLHKAGLRKSGDVNLARAEVAGAQMSIAQQRAKVAVAYGKLLTSLGIPIETKLEVMTDPGVIDYPLISEGITQLIAVAEEQRADVLAKKATLAEMQQRVKRESRSFFPKLRALGQGGWLQYTKHQGSSYNYNVGVALEIPIFNGFETTYHRRLALADEEMTMAELKELQEEIALEVLSHSQSVQAALEALQWSHVYVDESTQSYAGSMENYRAGLQNIFDLIQSQRFLTDARIRNAQATTQWLVSLANLSFATGSLTP